MSGWVPMPAEVWEHVSPHLPLPWCEEAARFDLRWHYDRDGDLPSRGDLAKRWGWTRDEVRTELRHPERWWDPLKGPLPTSRESLTQRDPARPSLTQVGPTGTGEPAQSSTPDPARPTLTQPDPASPHAGRDSRARSPSPPPPPPPEETQRPAPPVASVSNEQPVEEAKPSPKASGAHEAFTDALQVWNERVVPVAKVAAHPRLSPARGIGQKLNARLREHGRDDVVLVFRWYARSPDDRAKFLREGHYELGTIVRPEKFEDYLARARTWRDANCPTTDTAITGRNAHTWRDNRTDEERRAHEERAEQAARELELEHRQREAG